jgi:transcription elongation factor Elf1
MNMSEQLHNMEITRCPYDSSSLNVDDNNQRTYLISCNVCGAKWQTTNAMVERVAEPDWEFVKTFQSEQLQAKESQAN